MGFTKKTWKDRKTEYPNRRLLTKENGSTELVTVSREEGSISAEGDAFSAENMNDLENRVSKAFTEVNDNSNVRWNSETDYIQIYNGKEWVNVMLAGSIGRDLYYNGNYDLLGGFEMHSASTDNARNAISFDALSYNYILIEHYNHTGMQSLGIVSKNYINISTYHKIIVKHKANRTISDAYQCLRFALIDDDTVIATNEASSAVSMSNAIYDSGYVDNANINDASWEIDLSALDTMRLANCRILFISSAGNGTAFLSYINRIRVE